ncbi:response regulator transcription factor [Pollutimonas harenae]|uniref:Helix-turn-helix domain-containing protein n=1 Tax=Pollutimonas harenae TaxID=657015 RepID=A0A853GXW1_9BURK|nr:helix-turn-helix domain-containing protein [Pollutimonas harenae]NYT84962.1 helix-turn-helix domain-containing protein [Pollutimonas harenae]TEA72648.1 response regulator transcription factor [Pollutimonas harenae]
MNNTLAQPAEATPHLLIIDDRLDELRLLIDVVRGQGYRLSIAFDGAQGYQRAQALQPDLILLDVHMPVMNGFDASRLLQSDPATSHIPIIFLTSASDLDSRLEGLTSGGVDYVIKPFEQEEVLARIRIHLKSKNSQEPQEAVKPGGRSQKDMTLVKAACSYLSTRLSKPPTQEKLAQALNTNEKRLIRAFRKELNLTVFEYIREQRIKQASQMLLETSLLIIEIAEELGFSSPANFATAFRAQVGITPSEFREHGGGPPATLTDINDSASIE